MIATFSGLCAPPPSPCVPDAVSNSRASNLVVELRVAGARSVYLRRFTREARLSSTAKPTLIEEAMVPHHGIGQTSGIEVLSQSSSVARPPPDKAKCIIASWQQSVNNDRCAGLPTARRRHCFDGRQSHRRAASTAVRQSAREFIPRSSATNVPIAIGSRSLPICNQAQLHRASNANK